MKKGDLVKVSNRGFTAIGVITEVLGGSNFCFVKYFAPQSTSITGGMWSHPYITFLSEVKHEKATCKT